MNKLIVLGIDPGTPKSRTGYCIYDGEKILKITTVPGVKIFDVLTKAKEEGIVNVIGIEINHNTHTYDRPNVSRMVMQKIARDVGRNYQAAMRIMVFALRLGFKVVDVPPKDTKMDELLFQKITKYTKRTSGHARDAWGVARRVYAETFFQHKLQEAKDDV